MHQKAYRLFTAVGARAGITLCLLAASIVVGDESSPEPKLRSIRVAGIDTSLERLGVMICADRRDKQLVRRFCDNGARLLICPSGGMFGPERNDPFLQARSRENSKYIVFVHPAEFLVTAPDGSIAKRILVGDQLVLDRAEIGTASDSSGIFFYDIPVGIASGDASLNDTSRLQQEPPLRQIVREVPATRQLRRLAFVVAGSLWGYANDSGERGQETSAPSTCGQQPDEEPLVTKEDSERSPTTYRSSSTSMDTTAAAKRCRTNSDMGFGVL